MSDKPVLKKLTKKEKFEYFVDYYKWHALIGFCAIVVLLYALNVFILNPPATPYISIAYMDFLPQQQADSLVSDLGAKLIPAQDQKKYNIGIYLYPQETQDQQKAMAFMNKLYAQLETQQITYIICDENMYQWLKGGNALGSVKISLDGNKYFKDLAINTAGKFLVTPVYDADPDKLNKFLSVIGVSQ